MKLGPAGLLQDSLSIRRLSQSPVLLSYLLERLRRDEESIVTAGSADPCFEASRPPDTGNIGKQIDTAYLPIAHVDRGHEDLVTAAKHTLLRFIHTNAPASWKGELYFTPIATSASFPDKPLQNPRPVMRASRSVIVTMAVE